MANVNTCPLAPPQADNDTKQTLLTFKQFQQHHRIRQ